MIDIQARKSATSALTRFFLHGETTNFQYMDEFPLRSKDHALKSIYFVLWGLYSDVREHRMSGAHALTPEAIDIVNRCILFLGTNREYEWDSRLFSLERAKRAWSRLLQRFFFRKNKPSIREQLLDVLSDEPQGDATVWPFRRRSDYEQNSHG